MKFLRKIGREVEKVKQSAESATGDGDTYACGECGGAFGTDHDYCPDCGEPALERVDDEGADDGEGGDGDEGADDAA